MDKVDVGRGVSISADTGNLGITDAQKHGKEEREWVRAHANLLNRMYAVLYFE